MTLIRPFRALRPVPTRAREVIAPPYDVLSSAEALERVKGKPWSFLHVSKAEIDLPAGTDLYAPIVYATAAENLQRMRAEGVLTRDANPYYYAYRATWTGGRLRWRTTTGPATTPGRAAASTRPASGHRTVARRSRPPSTTPAR